MALFGTRITIETDLFGALQGKDTIRPTATEVDRIHECYVRMAMSGKATKEDREVLTFIPKELIERERLEAIVFAGTDLALLLEECPA